MKLSTIYDRSNKVSIEIYQVVRQEKPCLVCGKLTPIAKICHEMFPKINQKSTKMVSA